MFLFNGKVPLFKKKNNKKYRQVQGNSIGNGTTHYNVHSQVFPVINHM